MRPVDGAVYGRVYHLARRAILPAAPRVGLGRGGQDCPPRNPLAHSTMNCSSVFLALGMCACLIQAARGEAVPGGGKTPTGTLAAPFESLLAARDGARAVKKERGDVPAEGIDIALRGGVYLLTEALELTAEDSGRPGAPIVFRSHGGENVRIVGGKEVGNFVAVRDAKVLARLDPAARGNVYRADLKALDIADFGQLTQRGFGEPIRPAHMELFFDDRPMTLARWPNGGYARIAGLPDGQNARRFQYDGDRPQRWADEPDVWVYGYWYHDWADTYMKVEAIDTGARTITTATNHRYGLRKGNRWHVLNVLAELDSPGEYYLDREKGVLYFWPPAPIGSAKAVVSVADSLIAMTDASHIVLRGLVLEACRGTAIRITGGSNNQVIGCTIRNTGNRAVSVRGTDHEVIGCDIYETGGGGIALSGGDRKTLGRARLLAENNHIHHFSRWCHTYRPAVAVSGCGNIVRNNLLHHGPHSAIQLSGNDHIIEYNEIHSVCHDTGDVGAFYMGRDWTARGTVIRYNYWHHIQGPGQHGAMGVYLDDQAGGIQIIGNIFHRVTRAVFIGGGCDNLVENNTFVDCNPSVHIDARGLGWQKKATDDPKGTLRSQLAAMPYTNDLWSGRYPELVDILKDDPGTPKRNRIVRNISVGGKWDDIDAATRTHQTVAENFVDEDPRFIDRAGGDFRLRADSPAQAMGFRPIPVVRIGLYRDRRRASWPVKHEPRELSSP